MEFGGPFVIPQVHFTYYSLIPPIHPPPYLPPKRKEMPSNPLISLLRKIFVPVISLTIIALDSLEVVTIQLFAKLILRRNIISLQHVLDATKRAFIVALVTVLQIIAPSKIRITTENASIPKGTFRNDLKKSRIISRLKPNSITICNHQIYTDWVVLWWIAHTSGLSDRVYIILKKSLEKIPLLGYGMRNFKLIFMNRKWELDRVNMTNALSEIDANARGQGPINSAQPISVDEDGMSHWDTSVRPLLQDREDRNGKYWPYNLILFPEGTNLSDKTIKKSREYAAKIGVEATKHTLLPRSTGLRRSLEILRPSLDILYDVTLGFSGIDAGTPPETKYSLRNIFLRGIYPEVIDIHIRAFNIDEIPIDNEEEFTEWLFKVWREKDDLMDWYYKTGTFHYDESAQSFVENGFNLSGWEVLGALALPLVAVLLVVRAIYLMLV